MVPLFVTTAMERGDGKLTLVNSQLCRNGRNRRPEEGQLFEGRQMIREEDVVE